MEMSDSETGARPVLVAVDFSAHSEAAILWAHEAARRFEAPLHVLHVAHDPADAPGYYTDEEDQGYLPRLEEIARKMFDDFLTRLGRDHPEFRDPNEFHTELVIGLPTGRILEVAERIGAQLIVLGSQGRTGIAHLMLGSKAEQVVRLSPIPVTIVKSKPAVADAP